ncbi:MAG TPA: dihydrolipoyl dehydrogenase [Ignavibacteriales bacterium]|nr:dihydrolipoyl dehydrogenase [Ignavibacteriales bacterium]HOL80354.1 dihydrolipoyl dehydrogenase [Ignavibacteriales bacterium]HOM64633.1 dihydrolipoyl dehydrogenase [Ignavibacteriales bacterium]HPD68179.1 dihydrolipoyl dehydrogenase [Ignavibacteriales bacterium]HPP32543.1 dihydrolipoyl dehydrogenase [Ignavibacteriales bacterium]
MKNLVVIGAGPGGYTAAFYAADLGLNVTLIEKSSTLGGVCLNVGCIPSKSYLHLTKVLEEAKEVSHAGIFFEQPKVDTDKMREYKNSVVAKLTNGLKTLAKQRKISVIYGEAKFVNNSTINVKDNSGNVTTINFDYAIIATGSRPSTIPNVPLSDRIWDSTDALELKTIPKKMLVVGGGVIGLELGSVYGSLGSDVTVIEFLDGLLPGADRDLVAVLQKKLSNKIKNVWTSSKVVSMEDMGNGIKVKYEGKFTGEDVFDNVLLSVGRKPNTEVLGLENTKIELNRGFIVVDEKRQTKEPNIFAIGDVVGNPMLAHKASAEAKVAVEAILGHKVAFEPKVIPSVVYTDPEVAWAGITENEAKSMNLNYDVVKFPYQALGRAIAMDRTEGFTKLIIEKETEIILGVAMIGPNAGDMITEGALAIEMGATVKDIALTIHPHPTLSESMMEAAEMFYGHCTHLYKPKK